jgi:hypothetical protein
MKIICYTTIQYIEHISNDKLDDMVDEDYGFFHDIEKDERLTVETNKRLIKSRRHRLLTDEELQQNRMNLIIINKYNLHINTVVTTMCIIINSIIIYNLFNFIYSL